MKIKSLAIKFLITVSAFIICNYLNTNAWASIYYVDATGGNDTNNGTSTASAWKTISKVNNTSFQAGDSVLFKMGQKWAEQLTIPSSGRSGNPITFGTYGSGTPPIISGLPYTSGNNLSYSWCILINNVNYINIDGFNLDGTTVYYDVIKVTGTSSYININNCEVHNVTGLQDLSQGIIITTSYVNVTNCNVHNNGKDPGRDHGIYIEGNNCIVDSCQLHDNAASGVQIYNGYNGVADNNIIRYCNIYNNGDKISSGAGMYLCGNNNTVYYNLIHDNTRGIFTLDNSTNNKVFNNTIVNNVTYGILISSSAKYFTAQNNIIYNNNSNWYDTGSAGPTQNHNVVTNPSFVSSTDFRLKSGSPCIDAGVNVNLTRDYEGDQVPQGAGVDIGAYEYGNVQLQPPSKIQVLP